MKLFYTLILFLGAYTSTLTAQVTAFPPDPIALCDTNNPNDQTEVFDLTIREDQIINGQMNVNVTYHPTSGDALGGQNAFPNPENYINTSNPQLIFIRLQSTAGQGSNITTLEISVLPVPMAEQAPQDVYVDDGDPDGMAIFDLTINEAVMIGSQDASDYNFDYFLNETDAIINENVIEIPTSYQNTMNPETIFVRFQDVVTGCFSIENFNIETDGSLGLDDDTFLSSIQLFPIPTTTSLLISSDRFSSEILAELYSVNGQKIISQTLVVTNGRASLDISEVNNGLYLLRITSETNSITKQLIKQ